MIDTSTIQDIKAFHKISDTLISAGQPTGEQYIKLKEAGVEVVINVLRLNPPSDQPDFSAIHKAGLRYYTVHYDNENPIIPMKDFISLMKRVEGKNILVHCALNWRASSILDAYFQITTGKINQNAINPSVDLAGVAHEYPSMGHFIYTIQEHYKIKILR